MENACDGEHQRAVVFSGAYLARSLSVSEPKTCDLEPQLVRRRLLPCCSSAKASPAARLLIVARSTRTTTSQPAKSQAASTRRLAHTTNVCVRLRCTGQGSLSLRRRREVVSGSLLREDTTVHSTPVGGILRERCTFGSSRSPAADERDDLHANEQFWHIYTL